MEPDPVEPVARPVHERPASVRYLGFRCTEEGRSYTLQVDGRGERRVVTVIIPNAAFAERRTRFQDAPDLCFAKLQRELDRDADLPDGASFELSPDEMVLHQKSRETPARKRRARPAVE